MERSLSTTLSKEKYSVSELGSVRFDNDKVICNWTVLEYSKWPQDVCEFKSPTFWHSSSTEWCMALCIEEGGWFLAFYLLSSKRDASQEARVKASLISSQGKEYEVYPTKTITLETSTSTPTGTEWVRVSDFFNREESFKKELKFQGEVVILSVINEPYKIVALHQEAGNIVKDLEALLESGDETDIVLCVGDKKLRAHRALLFARSPVFATMLTTLRKNNQENEMGSDVSEEGETESIDIKDVDPKILREVLHYIYTDTAPGIEKMADKLLVAADKFKLLKLKTRCEVELSNHLTVDNAAAIAVIALAHACNILKPSVISFIKKHLVSVLGSDGWVDAVEQNPGIVKEISRLAADKPVRK